MTQKVRVITMFVFAVASILLLSVFTSAETGNARVFSNASRVDLDCMKEVTVARDQKIIDAFDKFSITMSSAYAARQTNFEKAWDIQNRKERKTALMTAWEKFRTSSKTAHAELRTAKRAAWTEFQTKKRTCRLWMEETSTQSMDATEVV